MMGSGSVVSVEEAAKRLQPVMVSQRYRVATIPPFKDIVDDLELRLNNLLLPRARVEGGWLVFDAEPKRFALGKNLLGMSVRKRPSDVKAEIIVEKLEAHVKYR